MVEDAENDSKQHLPDAKNNGHLHLVGVLEEKLVLSHIPNLKYFEKGGRKEDNYVVIACLLKFIVFFSTLLHLATQHTYSTPFLNLFSPMST